MNSRLSPSLSPLLLRRSHAAVVPGGQILPSVGLPVHLDEAAVGAMTPLMVIADGQHSNGLVLSIPVKTLMVLFSAAVPSGPLSWRTRSSLILGRLYPVPL